MKYIFTSVLIIFSLNIFAQSNEHADSLNHKSQSYVELDSLVNVYEEKRDYEQALKYAEEALGKCNLEFSKEHENCIKCIGKIGVLNNFLGNYDIALKFLTDAKIAAKIDLGRNHLYYREVLRDLINLYGFHGHNKLAIPIYEEELEVLLNLFGEQHSEYIFSLCHFGDLYSEMGYYDKALPILQESLQLAKNNSHKDSITYGACLQKIGSLYNRMRFYDEALKYWSEALEIRRIKYGENDFYYLQSHQEMANLFWSMGKYNHAIHLLHENLILTENIIGPDNFFYATSLSYLGRLYLTIGQYNKSLQLLTQAAELSGKLKGNFYNYAIDLSFIAQFYKTTKNYEKALEYAKQYNQIVQEQYDYGATGQVHLASMDLLGSIYSDMGEYDQAYPIIEKVVNAKEEKYGKENFDYAISLAGFGLLHMRMENYSKAELYLNEALQLLELTIGKDHPSYSNTLSIISNLYLQKSNYESAFKFCNRAQEISISEINKIFSFSGDAGRTKFLKTLSDRFNLHSFATYKAHNKLPQFSSLVYNNELLLKGLLLEQSQEIRRIILATNDESLLESYEKWNLLKKQISNQLSKPINERVYYYDSLDTYADQLEQQMVMASSAFKAQREKFNITVNDVKENLREGEAAIEFISFNYFNKNRTDSTIYAALVLKKDSDHPAFVPLFEEKEIEPLLSSLSKYRSGASRLAYLNHLYTYSDRSIMSSQKRKSLTELIWQPLKEELKDIHTVYYASSGLLHRINLAAVPLSDTETIGDKLTLVQLGSTRQLVTKDKQTEQNNEVVLYGGIQYSMDTSELASISTDIDTTAFALDTRGSVSFSYTDSTLRGGNWNYLPGTKKEIDALNEILTTNNFTSTTYSDYNANEESFYTIGKEGTSPKILHIATHGYFFPDPKDTLQRGIGYEPIFKISEHPMIRSGLILAGSEYAWEHGKPYKENMEDGILTAYEISQMDLNNTELVVLSACETGLGDIDGNEGVYGLQRAFKKAGANYLIMTLWQIADSEKTQDFMFTFYKHYISEKKPIPESFQLAQSEMKAKYKDPFYWAGFVLID